VRNLEKTRQKNLCYILLVTTGVICDEFKRSWKRRISCSHQGFGGSAEMDRAHSLLNCAGATKEEVLELALDALLSKIDPVEKAKRAEKRAEKKTTSVADVPTDCTGATSKPIPAKTKHQLFRNNPQCSYVSPAGRRCNATTYLQIDHIQMRCRNGTNDPKNLRLLCSEHNLYEAEKHLGQEYIKQKISSATHTKSVVLN